MKCEEQAPALFVFVVSLGVSWAAGPCCQEGETLTAEDNCLSSTTLDLTTPALTASCQGRLHQISAEMFEMTKFGGWLTCHAPTRLSLPLLQVCCTTSPWWCRLLTSAPPLTWCWCATPACTETVYRWVNMFFLHLQTDLLARPAVPRDRCTPRTSTGSHSAVLRGSYSS